MGTQTTSWTWGAGRVAVVLGSGPPSRPSPLTFLGLRVPICQMRTCGRTAEVVSYFTILPYFQVPLTAVVTRGPRGRASSPGTVRSRGEPLRGAGNSLLACALLKHLPRGRKQPKRGTQPTPLKACMRDAMTVGWFVRFYSPHDLPNEAKGRWANADNLEAQNSPHETVPETPPRAGVHTGVVGWRGPEGSTRGSVLPGPWRTGLSACPAAPWDRQAPALHKWGAAFLLPQKAQNVSGGQARAGTQLEGRACGLVHVAPAC